MQIPSIQVTHRKKARRPEPRAIAPSTGLRRRHTVGEAQTCLRSHVGELKRTLTFSEDVISSISPQALSYQQARERLARVLRPAQVTRLGRDVGRHNCRGDARRHPLCLLPPAVVHEDRERSKPHRPLPPSQHQLPPSTSSTSHGNVASHPSNMLYRRIVTVPANKSVQWKEQALEKISSSTATRFRGGQREGREVREEVEEETVEVSEGVKDGGEVEGDRRRVDYMACLERGARSVWTRGRRDVISLDNDTTFTKVLQSSYPQSHTEWCEGEEGEEEGERESLVRGGRRWTALPRPAPVSLDLCLVQGPCSLLYIQVPERLQWRRPHTTSPDHQSQVEDRLSPLPGVKKSSSRLNYCRISMSVYVLSFFHSSLICSSA